MSYILVVTLEEKVEVLIVWEVLHTLHLLQGKNPFRFPNILILGGQFMALDANLSFSVWFFLNIILGLAGRIGPRISSPLKIFQCFFITLLTHLYCDEKVVMKAHSKSLFMPSFTLVLGFRSCSLSILAILTSSSYNISDLYPLSSKRFFKTPARSR